jgi:PIN domain nuclease of toxin-antitoxin system
MPKVVSSNGQARIHYAVRVTEVKFATKYRIGRLPLGERIMNEWDHRITVDRFQEITISSTHAFRASTFLAAQGILEHMPIVTPDERLEVLGANRVW